MSRSYSVMAKFIHWAFIGVFAIGVINQVDEVEELESTVLLVTEVVFAVVFLSLLLFRFIYMRTAKAAFAARYAQTSDPAGSNCASRHVCESGVDCDYGLNHRRPVLLWKQEWLGAGSRPTVARDMLLDKRKFDWFAYCRGYLSSPQGRRRLERHGAYFARKAW